MIAKPNTFTSNTTISSSQVNANFDTIYNEFNGNIAAANLATDSVVAAKIATDAVTTAKIQNSAVSYLKVAAGMPVQVVSALYTAQSTGTGIIPRDNTIPQNTEGDERMTLAITPKATSHILVIEVTVLLSSSIVSGQLTAALFQDTTANALAVGTAFQAAATGPDTIRFNHTMSAGTTSATTFKVNVGTHSAATTTFNGGAGVSANMYGATTKSSIVIWEYKA